MRNPYFDRVLDTMSELHDRKNEDYAADGNPFSNFEGVALMTGLSVDHVFQTIIGIKMMRLRELLAGDKTPNFESIDDTIQDLAVYAAIWKAYRLKALDDDFDTTMRTITLDMRDFVPSPALVLGTGDAPQTVPSDGTGDAPTWPLGDLMITGTAHGYREEPGLPLGAEITD